MECDILGAGTNCKVVINILILQGYTILGIYDDDCTKHNTFIYDIPVKGFIKDSIAEYAICSIGNNIIREQIVSSRNNKWISAIHPNAIIEMDVQIGVGCIICPGVIIQPGSIIYDHSILNTNSSVDHDCVIMSFSHIAPSVCLCGGVTIGKGVLVGAGAIILPNLTVYPDSVIGAGCVLRKNIFESVIYKGN